MPPDAQLELARSLEMLANVLAANGGHRLPGGPFYKHTTPTGTPSNPYMHGPGGLFGVAGLDRDVFSTRIQPHGLAEMLPAYPDIYMNPQFAYITGFRDVSGSNPSGVCDDGQVAGPIKNCLQTAHFGRYTFMTRELEVNRVGQVTNRGEFLDLQLVNDPLVEQLRGLFQGSGMVTEGEAGFLASDMAERMLEVGVAFQNKLIPQVYIGNPANDAAAGGYKEFPGLDILIGTDKVDAQTGQDCPSLDSDIKNFNYGRVDLVAGNNDIVHVLSNMVNYLQRNAEGMNFGDVTWWIAMRRDLFWELTAIWPCSYLTYRCAFRNADGTQVLNVDAADQIRFRDAMRNGKYLLINGVEFPVVLDDGIAEEDEGDNAAINGGEYASDIYVIPVTVRGRIPVTYFQYFDYAKGSVRAIREGRQQGSFWTDGGRFLWHTKPPLNWCIQLISKIEPRIILRTPQLAGRLLNVKYMPLQHTRDALPTDNYFVDGGVYTPRAAPSNYSDWNLPR